MTKPAAEILLVEDDEPNRRVMALCLEGAGYNVTLARNGREAASLLDSDRFDLVITDMLMPEADGIEVLMHIRNKRLKTPVIPISGGGLHVAAPDGLKIAVQLGARAPLVKPFSVHHLLAAVESVLRDRPNESTSG